MIVEDTLEFFSFFSVGSSHDFHENSLWKTEKPGIPQVHKMIEYYY